jgi:hypothetical protein
MRDWLEASKQRWMQQYGHLNAGGKKGFPGQHRQITGPKGTSKHELAEAKQSWEYINYMENGYTSTIDDAMKGVMREFADRVSMMGLKKTENFLNYLGGGEELKALGHARGISGLSKNLAFNAYLSTNPLRQVLIQGHQAVQIGAIEPLYFSTKLTTDSMGLLMANLGWYKEAGKIMGMSPEAAKRMSKAFESTGFAASIDRQSMVNGGLRQMADSAVMKGGAGRAIGFMVNAPRQVGFDTGELLNRVTSYMTFRHRALRDGGDVDSVESAARIAEEANNWTYNMNRAGDLPYNQNSAAALMQFMQVPHKALTTMLFNKGLKPREKAQLGLFNLAMYGVPASFLIDPLANKIDPEFRESLETGMEGVLMNGLLSAAVGEETSIDFSSLAPTQLYGLYETLYGLVTDPSNAIANSPGGSLVFGNNPRITNAIKDISRYSAWVPDDKRPMEVLEILEGFAKISSGYSNWLKFQAIDDARKLYSASGQVLAEDVSTPEQIAVLFGLMPEEVSKFFESQKTMSRTKKEMKDDVAITYKELKRELSQEGITADQMKYIIEIRSYAWKHMDSRQEKEEWARLLRQDVKNKDAWMFSSAMRLLGMQDFDEYIRMIDDMPMDNDAKELLKKQATDIYMRREENDG